MVLSVRLVCVVNKEGVSIIMTQMVKSLVQCNKCNSAGHPNQMIGFLKTDKKKSDGRPFWDLVNADMSPHIHKTTVVLPDIEEPIKNTPAENVSNSRDRIVGSTIYEGVTLEDLKKRVEVMENWIKKLSESWVMNQQQ